MQTQYARDDTAAEHRCTVETELSALGDLEVMALVMLMALARTHDAVLPMRSGKELQVVSVGAGIAHYISVYEWLWLE